MNDFEAWQKIIEEWKQVDKMKRDNQELYDLLASSLLYIWEYSEKNNITLPNRERLNRTLENINNKCNQIQNYHRRINSSDESLQQDDNDPNRRQLDGTLQMVLSPLRRIK